MRHRDEIMKMIEELEGSDDILDHIYEFKHMDMAKFKELASRFGECYFSLSNYNVKRPNAPFQKVKTASVAHHMEEPGWGTYSGDKRYAIYNGVLYLWVNKNREATMGELMC